MNLHVSSAQEATASTILLAAIPTLLLFFGFILVFITPPIQSADEDSHFIRSVMVSEGHFFNREENGNLGQDVPASLTEYTESHRSLAIDRSERYSYQRWYVESYLPPDSGERVLRGYSAQSLSPLYYLPQSIGIWVGKLLYAVTPASFNWPAALYFGRLGNLAAYILGFWLAMKAAPRFASILAFLAATPMGLSLAASCSYDVVVILSAVGFFAAVVSAADRDGAVSWKHYALILALAFAVGHSKAVYAPVLMSLFMLWKPLGHRDFFKLAMASGGAAIIGMVVSSVLFGLPANAELQQAIDGQISYLANNLGEVPALLMHSFQTQIGGQFVSAIGNLGWLSASFPMPFIVCWFAVGLAAIASDGIGQSIVRPFEKAAYLFSGAVLATIALFIAMYVTWTSYTSGVGAPVIDSVQGRYLLPIVPFFMAAISITFGAVFRPNPEISVWIARKQVVLSAAVQAVVVLMIILRYWIPTV